MGAFNALMRQVEMHNRLATPGNSIKPNSPYTVVMSRRGKFSGTSLLFSLAAHFENSGGSLSANSVLNRAIAEAENTRLLHFYRYQPSSELIRDMRPSY